MAKAPTDKTLPNLDNATASGLVDMLGDVRKEIKRLQFLEGVYKEALKVRCDGEQLKGNKMIEGDKFCGRYKEVTQERIQKEAILDYFREKPEELAKLYGELKFMQLDITLKG